MMHEKLIGQLEELQKETRRRVDAIGWANEVLDKLGLTPLLDIARLVVARPNYGSTANIVTLYFDNDQRPAVMPILTDCSVEEWHRSQQVSFDNDMDSEHRYGNWLYVDFDYWVPGESDARHLITIRFASQVQEGDEIDGCHVRKTVVNISHLTLKCDVGNK